MQEEELQPIVQDQNIEGQQKPRETKEKKSKRKEIVRFRAKCCRNCCYLMMDTYTCGKDYAHVSPTLVCKQFEYGYVKTEEVKYEVTATAGEDGLARF